MASPMQRHASSSWPRLAWALAKSDLKNGSFNVAPVDRHALIPDVIM
jgi:hypothetical protein